MKKLVTCLSICLGAHLCSNNNAYGQFYVSKNVCVADQTLNPSTGMPEGCSSPTQFFDTDTSSTSSTWSFGDGGGASGRQVSYSYSATGNFTVTLYKSFKSQPDVAKIKNIVVGKFPNQPKFNDKVKTDTTVCSGSSLKLDPFKGLTGAGANVKYLWFPTGDTTSTIKVDSSGCYSVMVSDRISGCSRSAIINVKFCYKPPKSGSLSEKWFFGAGGILEFKKEGKLIPRDSLASDGDLNDKIEYQDVGFSPKPNPSASKINANGSVAMVFDKDQKLAFYSDGTKVFSGEDDSEIPLLGGGNLNVGGVSSAQGLLLVPKPNCNSCDYTEFYLFKVDPKTRILSYSIIDKRYNNKLGAVTEVDIPVAFPVAEKILGSIAKDEMSFDILATNPVKGEVIRIGLDTTGVTIKTQTVGSLSTDTLNNKGYIAVSPNERKVATGVVLNNKNYVEVFDQDPLTKDLSNPILIDLNIASPPSIYGITFSPSGDIIYVSISGDPAKGQRSYFIQLSLIDGNAAAIGAEKQIIASSTTESYGAVLRGPLLEEGDKKFVYLSIKGKTFMPYVQKPDVKGNAININYDANGTILAGTSSLGLPNLVKSPQSQEGEGLSANYSGNCQNFPTIMTTQGVCSPMKSEATWTFPDGSTKDGLQVSYTFTKTGWQNVKLTLKVTYDSKIGAASGSSIINNATQVTCTTLVYNGTIFIKPSPDFTVTQPLYLCLKTFENKSIGVKPAGGTNFDFDWKTGLKASISKDSVYKLQYPGSYFLEVKNEYSCSSEKPFRVEDKCIPVLYLPEVFSPNGDGINESFIVFKENIIETELKIFNRWGELIFENKNLDLPYDISKDLKWDGKFMGQTVPAGLYPYTYTYTPEYFPDQGRQIKRGAILILR